MKSNQTAHLSVHMDIFQESLLLCKNTAMHFPSGPFITSNESFQMRDYEVFPHLRALIGGYKASSG